MIKHCLFFIFLFSSLWGTDQPRTISSHWNGQSFYEHDLLHIPPEEPIVKGLTVYFKTGHINCYGHALLDGVFPFYALLKQHGLLNTPINLAIAIEPQTYWNASFRNILQLMNDIFKIKQIVFLYEKNIGDNTTGNQFASAYIKKYAYFEQLVVNEHVPFSGMKARGFSFYGAIPESFAYIYALKDLGLRDNVIFQDTQSGRNLVKEFVDFVTAAYQIDLPIIKNRVLVAHRPDAKRILNEGELIQALKNNGYAPVSIDFEKLTIRQQIIETIQSEYYISTYGSHVVNAMFLRPEANLVLIWHKYAKYFWSRRYCVIHSAFLSAGVKLVEYDQPEYESRNIYTERIHVPDYFYREKKMNILRPEKINLEAMINYPLPAMYEITSLDFYIEPGSIINLMQESKYHSNN